MQLLNLTLPTPAENLALDDALLEEAESNGQVGETLRLWEPCEPMVVVGRSSRVSAEVHIEACRRQGIPILRRISGGAAIVTGPGCLMYALVLSYRKRPELRLVDRAHRHVLGTLATALSHAVPGVGCQGISDLAVDEMKVSGNSMRTKRNHLLYHGTLLYDFPPELIERCLTMPPRMPDYRSRRGHQQFVTNVHLGREQIREAVIDAWGAGLPRQHWPRQCTAQLVTEKYGRPQWNAID